MHRGWSGRHTREVIVVWKGVQGAKGAEKTRRSALLLETSWSRSGNEPIYAALGICSLDGSLRAEWSHVGCRRAGGAGGEGSCGAGFVEQAPN